MIDLPGFVRTKTLKEAKQVFYNRPIHAVGVTLEDQEGAEKFAVEKRQYLKMGDYWLISYRSGFSKTVNDWYNPEFLAGKSSKINSVSFHNVNEKLTIIEDSNQEWYHWYKVFREEDVNKKLKDVKLTDFMIYKSVNNGNINRMKPSLLKLGYTKCYDYPYNFTLGRISVLFKGAA